ncbi:hypothetical protein Tco_1060569 [Tanacetum coccineum]
MTYFLANEAPVRCSATLLFCSYEFPLLAASSGKLRYLSSPAIPRRLPVLSNFARNFFWTSGVLVKATTSAMDCDSCKKDWGNGCGSNETPTKGVDDLGVDSLSSSFQPLSGR